MNLREKVVAKTVLLSEIEEQGNNKQGPYYKTIVVIETDDREKPNTVAILASTEKNKAQTALLLEIKRGLAINNELMRLGGGLNSANYCDRVDSLRMILERM